LLIKRWVPEYEQDFLWAHTREIRERRKQISREGHALAPKSAGSTRSEKAATGNIPSETPRKKRRYIPGGPGGGGRYVDDDENSDIGSDTSLRKDISGIDLGSLIPSKDSLTGQAAPQQSQSFASPAGSRKLEILEEDMIDNSRARAQATVEQNSHAGRVKVAKSLATIGDFMGNPAQDRFDDSQFTQGKAVDWPEIPGEEQRNSKLSKIRETYNQYQEEVPVEPNSDSSSLSETAFDSDDDNLSRQHSVSPVHVILDTSHGMLPYEIEREAVEAKPFRNTGSKILKRASEGAQSSIRTALAAQANTAALKAASKEAAKAQREAQAIKDGFLDQDAGSF